MLCHRCPAQAQAAGAGGCWTACVHSAGRLQASRSPRGLPGKAQAKGQGRAQASWACTTQQVLTAPQTWHKHACALMSIPPPGAASLAGKVKGTYGRPSCTPCPPLTYHYPRRPEGAREPARRGLQAGWCSLGWARDHSAGSAHSSGPAALTSPPTAQSGRREEAGPACAGPHVALRGTGQPQSSGEQGAAGRGLRAEDTPEQMSPGVHPLPPSSCHGPSEKTLLEPPEPWEPPE